MKDLNEIKAWAKMLEQRLVFEAGESVIWQVKDPPKFKLHYTPSPVLWAKIDNDSFEVGIIPLSQAIDIVVCVPNEKPLCPGVIIPYPLKPDHFFSKALRWCVLHVIEDARKMLNNQ